MCKCLWGDAAGDFPDGAKHAEILAAAWMGGRELGAEEMINLVASRSRPLSSAEGNRYLWWLL